MSRADPDRLAEVGEKFAAQWVDRRPVVLRNYVTEIAAEVGPCSFDALVRELRFRVLRRSMGRDPDCPVIEVCTESETLTYTERGRERDITFGRLRNILTAARKVQFTARAKT